MSRAGTGIAGWVLSLAVLLLGPGVASAQNVLDSFTPHVNAFDMRDLESDGDGNLWIASNGGALRFNVTDREWTVYHRLLGTGPRGNDLVSLCIDSQGRVWTGSASRGFSFFDPAAGTWDRNSDEWPDPAIRVIRCLDSGIYIGTENGMSLKTSPDRTDICADSDPGCIIPSFVINDFARVGDTLWVATESGLGRFNGSDWDSAGSLPGGSVGQESRSLVTFDGTLWEANDGEVRRLVGGAWENFPLVVDRLVVEGGTLYALPGDSTIYRFDGIDFVNVATPLSAEWEIRDMAIVGGNTYLATNFGLLEWDGGTAFPPRFLPPTPPLTGVYSGLAVDRDGTVWAATSEGRIGLVRLTGEGWVLEPPSSGGLVNAWVLGLLRDGGDGLWVGHCCCPDPPDCPVQIRRGTSYLDLTGRFNALVFSEDPQGRVWSGHRGTGAGVTVSELSEGVWRPLFDLSTFNTGGAMASNSVTGVVATANGTYIGHRQNGLDYWPHAGNLNNGRNGSNWIRLEADIFGSLFDDNVGGMVRLGSDVWVGTAGGLHRLRDGSIQERCPTVDRDDAGGRLKKVNVLVTDRLGNLWVGTDSGVLHLPRGAICDGVGGDFLQYSAENSPLPDDRVVAGALSPFDGSVWFGTASGLLRIDPLVFSGSAPPPDELVLYPNPLDLSPNSTAAQRRVFLGIEVAGLRVDPASAADFSRPEVFDIVGRPVGEFDRDNTVSGGAWVWTGRNRKGDFVAPGLYIVRSQAADGTLVVRKVGVVR